MPKPLTKDQLSDIAARNRDNPDMVAVLWGVHRLRQLAIKARQYLIHERQEDRNELLRETSWEPVVSENSPGQTFGPNYKLE
jgi:hypothetical protein